MSEHIERWVNAAQAYGEHSLSRYRWQKPTSQAAKVHDNMLIQMSTAKFRAAKRLLRQSNRRIHLGYVEVKDKIWKLSFHFDADGFGAAFLHPNSDPEEIPVVTRVDLYDIVTILVHELNYGVNSLLQRIYQQVDYIAEQTPK